MAWRLVKEQGQLYLSPLPCSQTPSFEVPSLVWGIKFHTRIKSTNDDNDDDDDDDSNRNHEQSRLAKLSAKFLRIQRLPADTSAATRSQSSVDQQEVPMVWTSRNLILCLPVDGSFWATLAPSSARTATGKTHTFHNTHCHTCLSQFGHSTDSTGYNCHFTSCWTSIGLEECITHHNRTWRKEDTTV